MLQKYVYLLIIQLVSNLALAEIIKDDNVITKTNKYSFQEVCKNLTKRNSPLIEAPSVNELDCMGKVVKVDDFCDEKEAMNDFYSRAIVSKEEKKVLCLSSSKVHIKYKCTGKDDRYCKESEQGCFFFKEKLAKKLNLQFHSLKESLLSCYFMKKTSEDIISKELKVDSPYKRYKAP